MTVLRGNGDRVDATNGPPMAPTVGSASPRDALTRPGLITATLQ